MRKILFGTLIFVCLGVTCASAETVRKKDDHSSAGFGVGGWTMGSAVGGWKQDSTSKTFNNASAGGVSSSATAEASSAAAGAVSSSTANLSGLRPWTLRKVPDDSGCVFVTQETPTGNLWRPGCK